MSTSRTITSLARDNNAKKYLKYLLDVGLNFELQTSNYTTTIILPNDLTRKYVINKQSNRTFAAFSKIKKDIKGKRVPKISSHNLIYFQHDFINDIFVDEVINIDLRSAYATILVNDGFISMETFQYLAQCNKKERLAAVGMLASRKRIFQYKKGQPIKQTEIVNPKAGIFFHAVKKTYEIMTKLKQIAGSNYLFTWVDGIYILPDKDSYFDIIKELGNYNIDFKTEFLKDFEIRIRKKKAIITFKKPNSKGKMENKVFQLPVNQNEYQKSVIETIKTHLQTIKSETSKITKRIDVETFSNEVKKLKT